MTTLLLFLMIAVVWVAVWWRIFTRMGFAGVLSLLMLVPVLNFVLLLVIAFAPEWPIEEQLRWHKGEPGLPPPRRSLPWKDPPPGDDWI
jgi:hypothetical protein